MNDNFNEIRIVNEKSFNELVNNKKNCNSWYF
jgi:hypothetical protein